MDKTEYEMLDDIDKAFDATFKHVQYPDNKLSMTIEDRQHLIATLKWAEDLLREAGQDVLDVQDCIILLRSL